MPRILAPNSATSGEVSSSESTLARKSQRLDTLLNIALAVTFCAGIAIYKFPIFSRELYVSQPTYNFGTVKAGTSVRHTFTLRNLHPWTVIVTGVSSDCGCTKAFIGKSPPFQLFPLEAVKIDTQVETKLKQDYVSQTVRVSTTDATNGTSLYLTSGAGWSDGHETGKSLGDQTLRIAPLHDRL
ncbi:hypothetical protein B1R32_1432 [Abditibacterium utsteinense]|uniref:DUF1573 domain-containing protein n=1 Tax=Abditibacterium utsteinense TaxID=1960156 RepID=A0A2S8SNH8_9BACT|nr:DUF1573 domain-containing protein [Abditibacterium utsteinense]PQV62383.1 hypothetical protein B1R32_1432 [Abditibacterium utsteinense]